MNTKDCPTTELATRKIQSKCTDAENGVVSSHPEQTPMGPPSWLCHIRSPGTRCQSWVSRHIQDWDHQPVVNWNGNENASMLHWLQTACSELFWLAGCPLYYPVPERPCHTASVSPFSLWFRDGLCVLISVWAESLDQFFTYRAPVLISPPG